MGIYVGAVVQALVNDLIMPIIQFFLPLGIAWESFDVGVFRAGHFFSTVLTFIFVTLVIFLIVKLSSGVKIEKFASKMKGGREKISIDSSS